MDQAEMIRVYFRAIIASFFMTCFGYVLYKYVGVDVKTTFPDGTVTAISGKIKPEVVYSWLTGLIMGFIAFYFAGEAVKVFKEKGTG